MPQSDEVILRWAYESEWIPTIRMIWDTFMLFDSPDYSREGIQNFLDFLTDPKLHMSFLRGEYHLMVAVCKGQIVGAGSVRNGNFLSLLFVDRDYQRLGIGKALIRKLSDYLKHDAGQSSMIVQSSPYAEPFYLAMGFERIGDRRHIAGIVVTAMEKQL